jgi:hypothetical protein
LLKLLLVVLPVVSAFGGVLLTNRTNRKINKDSFEEEKSKSKRSAIQEHGAELYTLIEAWSTDVADATVRMGIFSQQKLDPPVASIAIVRDTSRLLHARFVVEVYFASLSPLIEKVGRLYLKLGNEALAVAEGQRIESAADDAEIDETRRSFREAVVEFEQAVIVSVREYV